MEAAEEAMASNNNSDSVSNGEFVQSVVKGKRTKRQRTQPSPPLPLPLVLSMAVADSSSTSSAEAASETITEEEEDMANCLILLAQGRALDAGPKPGEQRDETGGGGGRAEKCTSRRLAEVTTATTNGKAGLYVYECKTCKKCFPSFQALGGHRTSHKKPKLAAATTAEEKKLVIGDDMLQISMNSLSKPIAYSSQTNTKPKVHECSLCGSEFSSGQALGGHMRRHRPMGAATDSQESKKEKSFLSLDLNLPAPADEELQRPPLPAFALPSKRPLIFPASASALVVDCHY